MKIKGCSFLVTGGAGFIGSHVVDRLIEDGAEKIVVFDNFSSGSKKNLQYPREDERISVVRGDILNFEALREAMVGVDVVSHQAAQLEIFRSLSDPVLDLNVNTIGTLNVLKSAVANDVKLVINASSACVYGQARYLPEDEEHPKRPHWPYGASKLAAEDYCVMFHEFYGLPVTSLRYGIVYGPREWYGRVLTIFIKRIFEKQRPVIFGDGNQSRDFVYVEDLAELHNSCIRNEKSWGEVLNVGTGVRTTMADLARIVARAFDQDIEPIYENPSPGEVSIYMPERRRIPGELVDMVLDSKKARKVLGWRPKTALEEGVRAEIEWFSQDSSAWHTRPKI